MPIPKPVEITVTDKEKEILLEIINKHSSKQIIVIRARIILEGVSGKNNTEISRDLKIKRGSVALWRGNWFSSVNHRELEQLNDKKLKDLILKILSDKARPGAPSVFTSEQIIQIISLSCTDPKESERPISHWTPRELTDEVLKKGIVESISETSIRRFFKRNGHKTR